MEEELRIYEIPKQYNSHREILLQDYQKGKISIEQVVQILILYQDEGVFLPLYETDTRQDFYWVNKGRHKDIEDLKKAIYKRKG